MPTTTTTASATAPRPPRSAIRGTSGAAELVPSVAPHERHTSSVGLAGLPQVLQTTASSLTGSHSFEGGAASRDSPSVMTGTLRTIAHFLQRIFLPESSGPTL